MEVTGQALPRSHGGTEVGENAPSFERLHWPMIDGRGHGGHGGHGTGLTAESRRHGGQRERPSFEGLHWPMIDGRGHGGHGGHGTGLTAESRRRGGQHRVDVVPVQHSAIVADDVENVPSFEGPAPDDHRQATSGAGRLRGPLPAGLRPATLAVEVRTDPSRCRSMCGLDPPSPPPPAARSAAQRTEKRLRQPPRRKTDRPPFLRVSAVRLVPCPPRPPCLRGKASS